MQFVGQFAKAPEIQIDTALIAQHERELQEVLFAYGKGFNAGPPEVGAGSLSFCWF